MGQNKSPGRGRAGAAGGRACAVAREVELQRSLCCLNLKFFLLFEQGPLVHVAWALLITGACPGCGELSNSPLKETQGLSTAFTHSCICQQGLRQTLTWRLRCARAMPSVHTEPFSVLIATLEITQTQPVPHYHAHGF